MIQEWRHVSLSGTKHLKKGKQQKRPDAGNSSISDNRKKTLLANKGGKVTEDDNSGNACGFCGKPGRDADKCFLNPDSPKCKLLKKAQNSMRSSAVSSTE